MINKNFTLIWIGKIISQLGDKFYAIALAWWILQETNSPSIMGVFLFTSVFPGVALGFFAGAFVDRFKRKNILIITDILRGSLVLLISILALNKMLQISEVFIIAFFLSIAAAFFEPAIQAIIPEIVDKEMLPKANGISQMISGITTVAGPFLGAALVSFFGIGLVFMANSISYFVSAMLTSFVFVKNDFRDLNCKRQILRDIKEGINFIRDKKRITLVLKIIAITHFFLGSLMVSMPFLANSISGKGINNLGILEMMLGAGMIGASLFFSIRKNYLINEQRLISAIVLVGISFLIIGFAQNSKIDTIYAYTLELIIIGSCIACASVFWQWLLQSYTPDHIAGRVFGISTLIGNISLPSAYAIFGIILEYSSISIVMICCGSAMILLSIYLKKLCRMM